ncbi:MmgE/PrpD family protein [Dyella halodurans]|uniref:MmgE/PrpD family protein n=1 Tax=Dyella halodurans TaxID=1920171 RepID=A0ABV9C2B4_9GAMM|nr:MmgE/PrpD family protein [Dyella halodurans]
MPIPDDHAKGPQANPIHQIHQAGAPAPRPAVEQIAAFADSARFEHLSSENRQLMKRNILDSLGCALAALRGRPFAQLRQQFGEFRGAGSCTLIGGGATSVDQAALYNSCLVRYVDLMDSYMSPGGLSHPSDNFGGVLAVAESVGATGKDFLLALAVAYEVASRFTATVPVMAKGFNHALQLSMSMAAASGKLMKLTPQEIAHAIAMAAVDNVSLAAVHSEPVSQWKGISPGITAMRTVYTTAMAKRGFTGPLRLFEGPNGLNRMFDQDIRIDWANPSLEIVRHTVMKKYCSLIHGQPVIEAALDLKREHDLSADEVAEVICETIQGGFDIAGGGSFGSKDHPTTKEQADYNLKYLIAVALLDNAVGPAQLDEERVNAPDTQALLTKVKVEPSQRFTQAYPDHIGCRLTIRTQSGQTHVKEQASYEGGLDQPLTWSRVVEKFNWLAEPYADTPLREALIAEVEALDTRPVSTLMSLLADVRPHATFKATLRGL